MNIIRALLMQIIAFVWMSSFGLILPIFWVILDIYTKKDADRIVHEFWLTWIFLTTVFWLLDIFSCWAIKRQTGTAEYTAYPLDYPRWKKVVHYATVGKYSKVF